MRKGNSVAFTLRAAMRVAGLLLVLAACSPTVPTTGPVAISKEPFNIKTNDSLGIKLGSALDDYQRKHKHDTVPSIVRDEEAFCPVPVVNEKLEVGGAEVRFYSLRFYRGFLINIDYSLTSIDWEALQKAMEEKFGLPTQRERFEAAEKKLFDKTLLWRNAVSSIEFDRSETDWTSATLSMQLDQETDQWLESSRKRKEAEAKRGL
jgi:hypothetical protein